MGNHIFKTLLQRQIDNFIDTFRQDSNSIFKNHDGRLLHPGEYGMYREECFKKLLQVVLDKDYTVSDGFIINSIEQISTQCDVLVHSYNAKPLTDGTYAKFYPVEDIAAIGEIKSDMTMSEFKNALRKLATNKMLGESRKIVKNKPEVWIGNFNPIPTFLVCNRLQFDLSKIDFQDIYEGIPRSCWHNCILSLEDGIIIYELVFSELGSYSKQFNEMRGYNVMTGVCDWQYSQHVMTFDGIDEIYNCKEHIIKVNEDDLYKHIYFFLGAVEQAVKNSIKYNFDFAEYLGVVSNSIK